MPLPEADQVVAPPPEWLPLTTPAEVFSQAIVSRLSLVWLQVPPIVVARPSIWPGDEYGPLAVAEASTPKV